MSLAGRALRRTMLAPGRRWRVPWGLARGLTLIVTPGIAAHEYLGTTELEIAGHIRRLATPGVRSFDIGGEVGYYALVLARLTGAQVTTFEFRPDAIARIERNLECNPALAGQVTVFPAYVAAERAADPRCETLDHLVDAGLVHAPDLIKIDVEGAEANVLRGAAGVLASARPHVIVETHSRGVEDDCVAQLRAVGYAPLIVDQRGWLRERRGAGHNRWLIAEGRG
jgi:methyltransferase FkbM-like protein